MMNSKFQIILVIALVLGLIAIVSMVRRKSLELKYALPWMIVDVIVVIIALVPRLLDSMAVFLGIYSVPNMVFFLGFCFLLVIVYILTVALSRNSNRLRKLSQEIALRDKENENKNAK